MCGPCVFMIKLYPTWCTDTLLSQETITIVDNLGLTQAQQGKVAPIVTTVQAYVKGLINQSVECRNFRRQVQQTGESFDKFLMSLQGRAKTCNFCTEECTQKHI